MQTSGVERVGQIVSGHLARLGFTLERRPQSTLAPDLRWLAGVLAPGIPYERLADTLILRREGSGHPVLLLGDLDTAFEPGCLEVFPFAIRDGRAYGPGVADMKGGLVVMVAALSTMYEIDLPVPPLVVVLSGDEQAGSLGSRGVIAEMARDARWCLCLECAREEGGKLMASRAHIGVGLVEANGRSAHAGSAWGEGVNAIQALVVMLPHLSALSDPSSGVFVTVTLIEGGRRRSLVPDRATAVLDLRTPDARVWDQLVRSLRNRVESFDRGSVAEVAIRVAAHRPGVSRTSGTDRLLELVRKAGAELGLELTATGSAAAGSSSFAAQAGAVVLDGMGPCGEALMTREESIDVDSIADRAAVFGATLQRLVGEHS